MTQDNDQATEFEQLRRDIAMAYRKPVPETIGNCLNCGAEVIGRYCDSSCREDNETRERISRHAK